CSYCGVGDGGTFERVPEGAEAEALTLREGPATLLLNGQAGEVHRVPASIAASNTIVVEVRQPMAPPGGPLRAGIEIDGAGRAPEAREVDRVRTERGDVREQHFRPYSRALSVFKEAIKNTAPSSGCVKLRLSTMRQRAAYPIHTVPSVLDKATGQRRPISYAE